jgi:glycosyltransferase involved in cell wall biosynthesis
VASVAEWLLGHEEEIGCAYVAFDLQRPPSEEMGGRLRLRAVPRQLRQLARFVRWMRRTPLIVHYCLSTSRTGLPRDALYVALLRLFGRQTIAHVHGAALVDAAELRFRSALLRLVGRSTVERVAISPTSARVLEGLGISSRCILNPLRFEPEESAGANAGGRALELLFVGAYGRRKGCPELIDALARARASGLDVRLRIVGKEDHKGEDDALRSRIRAHDLDGAVEFAGVRTASEMPSAYRDADAICLPSRQEGLPMALLEAMAFGLPVLATPVGGIPDLVADGDTGLLVAPGNVEELANAIATLAGDRQLRRQMGERARARVLGLAGSSVIAARWRELYRELALATKT